MNSSSRAPCATLRTIELREKRTMSWAVVESPQAKVRSQEQVEPSSMETSSYTRDDHLNFAFIPRKLPMSWIVREVLMRLDSFDSRLEALHPASFPLGSQAPSFPDDPRTTPN